MAPSGSIEITTSAPSTAACSVAAALHPSLTACCTEAGTRSNARTEKPALTRLAAIGPPMLPNPKNATVLVMPCSPSEIRQRMGCITPGRCQILLSDGRRQFRQRGRIETRRIVLVDDLGAHALAEHAVFGAIERGHQL